jgi:hypothetical protein
LRCRDAGFQTHGYALGGRERYVGNLVGVVAADEGEEGDDDVRGEYELHEDYGPCAVWDGLDDGVYGCPGVLLA